MSNYIKVMKLVSDLKRIAKDKGQPLNDEEIKKIIGRLNPSEGDKDVSDNFRRFDKGYLAETLFESIYSSLPWIKLITPLGQEQLPEKSKEEYQVPDYEIIYEIGSSGNTATVLIETKMIDGDKEKHVLKKAQYVVLKKYAEAKNEKLLIALFWRKHFAWTVVPIEAYEEKSSQYKISFQKALANDLSAIFGDYSYVFSKQLYRKSEFTKDTNVKTEYLSQHKDYGSTIYESVSLDGKNYLRLENFEAALLDTIFDFKKKEIIRHSALCTTLIEELEPTVCKLSSAMLGYLFKLTLYENDELYIREHFLVKRVFGIVDTIRRKCGGEKYYLLPEDKSTTTNELFARQFSGCGWIMDAYNNVKYGQRRLFFAPHVKSGVVIAVTSDV